MLGVGGSIVHPLYIGWLYYQTNGSLVYTGIRSGPGRRRCLGVGVYRCQVAPPVCILLGLWLVVCYTVAL